jgi:hypothetical protein
VNIHVKSLDFPVRTWPLVGPTLAFVTLLILLFRESTHSLDLPIAAIFGIAVAWMWQARGLAVAVGLIAFATFLRFFMHGHENLLWDLSVSLAITLSCVVTALSSMEVDSLNDQTMKSTVDHLEMALAKVQRLEHDFQQEQNQSREAQSKAAVAIELLKRDLQLQITHSHTVEEVIGIARQEYLNTAAQNEKLKEEVFSKRHEVNKLQEQLETALSRLEHSRADEQKIREAAQLVSKQEIHLLTKALEKETQEHEELKHTHHQMQEEHLMQQVIAQEMGDVIDTLSREKQLLESTLKRLQGELESLSEQQVLMQTEHEEERKGLQLEAESLLNQLNEIKNDPELLSTAEVRRIEGLYKQLREQFEEKSLILDEVRRELFHTQEQNAVFIKEQQERELQEPLLSMNVLETEIARLDKQHSDEKSLYQQEIDELYTLVDSLVKKGT